MKYILVTGGTGFIGSHTCTLLLENNYKVIIIDNLIHSNENIVSKIELITNKKILFFKRDLSENIEDIFIRYDIHAVIHFAALKSVPDSISNPIIYYKNNIISTINLIETMQKYKCHNLIFSSSATVYGNNISPLSEDMITGKNISNPYGQTKFMIEQILKDVAIADPKFNIISLRYFNPIGAHPSGIIGESPTSPSSNLMPHILKSTNNPNQKLQIFGNTYNTPDGTCIRDYIHVMDVALAHMLALKKNNTLLSNYNSFNIGRGIGTSVLELIYAFEKSNNVNVPHKFVNKRKGDLNSVFCETHLSKNILNFEPTYSIEDACKHAWNFYQRNLIIN